MSSTDHPSTCTSSKGILLLGLAAALHFAADILMPIFFAIFVYLLLSPIVDKLAKFGIPAALSALGLLGAAFLILIGLFNTLAEPAETWLQDAPRSIRDLQQQSLATRERLANIEQLAEEVDELTRSETPRNAAEVIIQAPGVVDNVVGGLPALLSFFGIATFLSFLLLASGDELLRRIVLCGRDYPERRRIRRIADQVQTLLPQYLVTITAINLALGIVVASVMYLLSVPNPLLWGAMVALLNFAPYLGAMVSTAVLTVVGLTTFGSLGEALMVPGSFLLLTIVEGQILTPAILGRRLSTSAVTVFLAVVSLGWLCGVAGALMAVPIVTTLVVILDNVPRYAGVSAFFRGDASRRRNAGSPERRFPYTRGCSPE